MVVRSSSTKALLAALALVMLPIVVLAAAGQFLLNDLGLLAASIWILLSARQEARK